MTIVLALALAAGIGVQAPSGPPEAPPPKPLTVFVFARAGGDTEEDRDLLRSADMVRKRIASRKRWFRATSDPEGAQVVVEVRSHSVKERLTIWASTGTMGGEVQGTTNYSVTEEHVLEAEVRLLGEALSLRGIDASKRGSLKGAANGLARELERECQKRYGEIPR